MSCWQGQPLRLGGRGSRRTGGQTLILYSFCTLANCADGKQPVAGLVRDSAGRLFGTTTHGGASLDAGTVFEVDPKTLDEKVLHNFCADFHCADGAFPEAPLIMDGHGNLYGTTDSGGAGFGTVFELVRGTGNRYTEKVLHSFCSRPNCSDGALPESGLVRDKAGFLYRTTKLRGIIGAGGQSNGGGTVFKLKP